MDLLYWKSGSQKSDKWICENGRVDLIKSEGWLRSHRNNQSLPDTENVVQLSKLFEVSTDYLLYDEIESNGDIPAVQENTTVLKNEFYNTVKMIVRIFCASSGLLEQSEQGTVLC